MTITLVAAMGSNRVIGRDGDMPWHFPEDLAHFKRTTMGGTMIMGRKTFDAIGRPLPGRRTIVITRSADWSSAGVDVAHSLTEAIDLAAGVDAGGEGGEVAGAEGRGGGGAEVFIVGGGDVYAQALPVADRLVLTEIDEAPEGDTFFPDWSRTDWVETERSIVGDLAFVTWERASH